MAKIDLLTFKQRLLTEPPDKLVKDALADDDPWLFRNHTGTYNSLKSHLTIGLNVHDLECIVVGSAKYGFSISPDSFGRAFRPKSDIDVAILSRILFDEIWASMTAWRYPWHTRKWPKDQTEWAVEYMEKHIAGFVDPLDIKVYTNGVKRVPQSIQPRATQWFQAFQLAGIGPAAGHVVEGRLYRTLSHLEMYMRWGLENVRRDLAGR